MRKNNIILLLSAFALNHAPRGDETDPMPLAQVLIEGSEMIRTINQDLLECQEVLASLIGETGVAEVANAIKINRNVKSYLEHSTRFLTFPNKEEEYYSSMVRFIRSYDDSEDAYIAARAIIINQVREINSLLEGVTIEQKIQQITESREAAMAQDSQVSLRPWELAIYSCENLKFLIDTMGLAKDKLVHTWPAALAEATASRE